MVNNANNTVLPLTTSTQAVVNSPEQSNANYRGLHLIINMVTVTSGTFTPKIQGKCPISGLWYDILVGSAINAVGVTVLKVYPGITAAANVSASDILPLTWRVVVTGASTPNGAYSVAAALVL